MATAQKAYTQDQLNQQHINDITAQLNQAGHNVTGSDTTPQNASTPVDKTEELNILGAELVGEDLSHLVADTLSELTGETTTRVTNSKTFLGKLMEKVKKKYPGYKVNLEDK